ncbi:hypothetical protein CLU79DRAFT_775395 [Phycomyces nitens]|nr:hypothetical protein CLU79DRAFT_775395 [Phycomyces nitens]
MKLLLSIVFCLLVTVVFGAPVPPSTGNDSTSIKINSPHPGAVWDAGSFQLIDWKNPVDHDPLYTITLYRGNTAPYAYERVLVKDISADLEFARIHVPKDATPATDYWIKISSGNLESHVKNLSIKAADSTSSSESSNYPTSEELKKISELPLYGKDGL